MDIHILGSVEFGISTVGYKLLFISLLDGFIRKWCGRRVVENMAFKGKPVFSCVSLYGSC